MAKVQFFQSAFSTATYKAFFDSLNCPLLTTEISGSDFYLYVGAVADNIFKYVGPRSGNAMLYVKGTNVIGSGWGQDNVPITVCYTDNFFFMYTRNSASNTRGLSFFYEELGDMKLYGYAYSTSTNTFRPLDIISLTDDVTGLQYSHSPRLNYNASVGYIDYVPNQLFQSGVITNINDNNFISCSTVSANQSITIAGKNYYSIGTNILTEVETT